MQCLCVRFYVALIFELGGGEVDAEYRVEERDYCALHVLRTRSSLNVHITALRCLVGEPTDYFVLSCSTLPDWSGGSTMHIHICICDRSLWSGVFLGIV